MKPRLVMAAVPTRSPLVTLAGFGSQGIEFLFKKNKVTLLKGQGIVSEKNTVSITDEKGKKSSYKAKNIVIATGSFPTSLPGIKIDEKIIVSSTGALSFEIISNGKKLITNCGYYKKENSKLNQLSKSKMVMVNLINQILQSGGSR